MAGKDNEILNRGHGPGVVAGMRNSNIEIPQKNNQEIQTIEQGDKSYCQIF